MKYKAVAGPKVLNAEKGATDSAVASFANIINQEATDGWRYHSMSTITVIEKPGCLQAPVPTNCYMLIFEKED